MKQAIRIIASTLLLVVFSLTTTSCEKAEAGPAGANGTNGADGNANVISSGEINLDSLWTQQGNGYYTAVCNNEQITTDVAENGLVMAYKRVANSWVALPLSNFFTVGDHLKFYVLDGSVKFEYSADTGTPSPIGDNWTVRIVIVPAGMKKPLVNHLNYTEVKEAYNL
jgi:hypothetical protein